MNAARQILDDQAHEKAMEGRISRLEADVEHIKNDVRDLRAGMQSANESLTVLRVDVGAIKATFATKEDLRSAEGSLSARTSSMEGSLSARISSVEGSLTTRISSVEGSLDAQIKASETRIIRWFVGTSIAAATLAFSVAKFLS